MNVILRAQNIYIVDFYLHFNALRAFPVPPERPIIYDANRREKAKNVEAYNEGSDVSLVCEVTGGKT